MNVIDKIREKGLSGCLKSVKYRIIRLYNNILFKKYERLPIDERSIVLESEGDCCDNAYALFDYMKHNGYVGKYKITWLVDHPENFQDEEDVRYVKKNIYENFSAETIKALRTCRWYIYDHCDLLGKNKKWDQVSVFLTHGAGFKAASSEEKCLADEVYTVSQFFYKPVSDWCGCNIDAMLDLGFPRLDYFFYSFNEHQNHFVETYKFEQYKKIFLWMPTFRKSINKDLSEDYFLSETGLPIICYAKELKELDSLLKKNNSLCIFKVHHLQAQMKAFNKEFSNILMFDDELIKKHDLQLYEFIMLTDALITDYSSISTDYMLLDRPIIYTMDDYEDYKNSRGFSIENPKAYFVGYHVYNKSQLYKAIQEVSDGIDFYRSKRKEILPILHSNVDGNASERILEHLGVIDINH